MGQGCGEGKSSSTGGGGSGSELVMEGLINGRPGRGAVDEWACLCPLTFASLGVMQKRKGRLGLGQGGGTDVGAVLACVQPAQQIVPRKQ